MAFYVYLQEFYWQINGKLLIQCDRRYIDYRSRPTLARASLHADSPPSLNAA